MLLYNLFFPLGSFRECGLKYCGLNHASIEPLNTMAFGCFVAAHDPELH
jgi:hypothetical protein